MMPIRYNNNILFTIRQKNTFGNDLDVVKTYFLLRFQYTINYC